MHCSSRLLENMRRRMRELEEENARLRKRIRESEDAQCQRLMKVQVQYIEGKAEMMEARIRFLEDALATAQCELEGSDQHIHELQQTVCSLRKQLFGTEVALRSAVGDAAREAYNYHVVRQKLSLTRANKHDLRQSVESMQAAVASIPALARRADLLDAVMLRIRELKECVEGMQEALADGITTEMEEDQQYALPCGHVFCKASMQNLLRVSGRNNADNVDANQMRCPATCPTCRKAFAGQARATRVRKVEEAIKHASDLTSKLDDIVFLNVPDRKSVV